MKSNTPLENQMRSVPSFHDALLLGISVLPTKESVLLICTEEKRVHNLVLLGVERLRAEDFRQGNIILDVSIQRGLSVKREEVQFALSPIDAVIYAKFIEEIVNRVHQGDLYLVKVNPSYGCEFACLCKDWILDPPREVNPLCMVQNSGLAQ